MIILLCACYLLVMMYSFIVAPDVFFHIFPFRHTPEYTFLYFIGCFILGLTLIGAVIRIYILLEKAK